MNKTKIAFINYISGAVMTFVAGISLCHADVSGQTLSATVSLIDPQLECKVQIVQPAITLTSVTYIETGNDDGTVIPNNPGDGPLIEVNTGIDSPEAGDPSLAECQLTTIDFKIQPSSPVTGPRCLPSTQPGRAGGIFYYAVGVGGVWSVNAAGARTPLKFPLGLLKDNKNSGSPATAATANGVKESYGYTYTPSAGATDVPFIYLNSAYVGPVQDSTGNIINPLVGLKTCNHGTTYGLKVELSDQIPADAQKIQLMVTSLLSDATYNTNNPEWNKEYGLVLDGENYSSVFTVTTTFN